MTPDIWRQVQSDFGGRAAEAEAEINALSAKTKELIDDRLLRCIVFLSHGDISTLRALIELARTDYRDVIWQAEYECGEDRKRDFGRPFKKTSEQQAGGYSPPAARPSKPTP